MDYIIVSTSKCAYQDWQLHLLNWSRKKVKQQGKLILLMSEDKKHDSDKVNLDFGKDVEVVELPDWAEEWHLKHDDWWGGIPNKYESFNWVAANYPFQDDDVLLFLDPNMIFIEPINYQPKANEIIGQRWKGYGGLPSWEQFGNSRDAFMYPFILRYSTLKTISEDFKNFCFDIRKQIGKWESDMWALDYAAKNNGVAIHYIDDFGFCTAWQKNGDQSLSKIIHFPNIIDSENGDRLFFKQDYTFQLDQKIEIQKARNLTDKTLLLNIDQQRTDFIYYLKWYFESLFKFYSGEAGYLYLKPYPGGFNNIRMSLELAFCLAYLTNRTLILPNAYHVYLLEGTSDFSTFFDLRTPGIKLLSLVDYCEQEGINVSEKELKERSKVLDFDTVSTVINFEQVPVPKSFSKGKTILHADELFKDEKLIYLNKNLLGSFEQVIYTAQQTELKQLVAKHIVYRNDIFDLAWQFINYIGDQTYYSIHVRRNDFQYKHLYISCDEIRNGLSNIIPSGSTLYIATDLKDKSFFEPLQDHYSIIFYNDILENLNLDKFDPNWIPIIEQLICTRSIRFIGMALSTLSSYIFRMRGYMNDIEDKYYYLNGQAFNPKLQCDFIDEKENHGAWCREYKSIWQLEPPSIFVSIAAYADRQLIPTILDLLENAANPSRVYIGIHLQDTQENYEVLRAQQFPNTRILFAQKEASKGVVWARNEIKRNLYQNEDFYLQIDAHTRFKKRWDNLLINQYKSLDNPKAIITTYPNAFELSDTEKKYLSLTKNSPLKIRQFLTNDASDNRLRPTNKNPLQSGKIQSTQWCAAGFIFARREWVHEIKLPDAIKFNGEEDLLTFLSFLNGYDLMLTSEATVWHNYNFKHDKTGEYYKESNENSILDHSIEIINEVLFNNTYPRSLSDLETYLDITFRHPNLTELSATKVETKSLADKPLAFYQSEQCWQSKGIRVIANTEATHFAWDIDRIAFLNNADEVIGTPISSGFAYVKNPAHYGAYNAFSDQSRYWGGRADEEGKFWLGIKTDELTFFNRIVLTQGIEHFFNEIDIQIKDDKNNWRTIETKSDLVAGVNDIPLFAVEAHKEFEILVWAINESKAKMQEMCASLIATAEVFGIEVTLFGVGEKFVEHKQRIELLHNYLQGIHPNTIILCMDGADTLFNDTKEELLRKFHESNTRILISAEKGFTYQYFEFKDKFDAASSPYRYINAGTFIGYAGDILNMFTDIIALTE